ncbi:ABC transporter ATP-binding protein [Galactobacter valiniphilus]|uniref:ABC transporter ATP-binding protein n=1 Tax=Galactobacter valiniphilus TaxID=2676122 RepID=A0A399JB81_9MICC|nr:ABC transporter ATP-binding protein [Galactobacter valiniphilus]RII42474.1 ABC transporter ATP-binding protein [Galactobacter valiniphilus]
MSLLEISQLTLDLPGGKRLLHGIDLTVEPGRTVGLVGESGSGKSLTARTALGLFPEKAKLGGSVKVDGTEVLGLSGSALRALRLSDVAMVFQDPRAGINPVRTLGDHLTEALRLGEGVSGEAARKRAMELMEAVRLPRPEKHFHQYPHELSGGQLQRIMIAGALMGNPRLLVCDEPTTALDVTTQAEIVRLLATLRDERGMGMLFITHDLGLAGALCDDVVVLAGGRVQERGDMAAVLAHPTAEYTQRLVAATPSLHLDDAVPSVVSGASLPDGAGSASAGGRHEAAPAASQAGAPEAGRGTLAGDGVVEPLLRVEGVRRTYAVRGKDPVTAVADASFVIPRGSALGVVGESGSGKSTLARMVVGLETPDAGTITVAGKDRTGTPRGREARLAHARSVQMVFQDPYLSLDPRIPVIRAVRDAAALHADGRDAAAVAKELLDRVGLTAEQQQALPRTLSGGQRQRVAMARALAVQPELLVMDEATSALDVSVQAQVLQLVTELRAERGLTVLFISHDLGVVRRVCDETLVLRRGEIVEAGPTAALLDHPAHEYTRLLLDSVPRPDAGWRLAG